MATSSSASPSSTTASSSWRRFLLPYLLVLVITTSRHAIVEAYPSGAGQCLVGKVSVGAPHLPETVGDGTLSFFGLQVLVDGTVLDATKSFKLTKGAPHKVEIKAATNKPFKGYLIVASSPSGTVDFSSAWTPDSTGQVANVCVAPHGGVTHTNNDLKTSAFGTLLVNADTDLKLDVTVVMERTESASGFGWAQYSGSVAAAAVTTASPVKPPTKAPTKKPTAKPVAAVTASPVKPPTKAPSKAPTAKPVAATTPSPIKPPSKAPTKKPTAKPVAGTTPAPIKPPTKAPSKAPTAKPAAGTTPSPVKPPTKSPTKAPAAAPTSPSPVKPPSKAPTSKPVESPDKPPSSSTPRPTRFPTVRPSPSPTVPEENRNNGNGGGGGGGTNTQQIRGWQTCFRRVQRQCECRRPSTFRCARRVARQQCQRGKNQSFVRAVKKKFGEYCRRTRRRRKRNRSNRGMNEWYGD